MKDLELQAAWQAQPRELPAAFTPDELSKRGPAVELVTMTSAFEEERLSRRLHVASMRASFSLALGTLLLGGAAVLHAVWLVLFGVASFVVTGWLALRVLSDGRALVAVRALRERPGDARPAVLPLTALVSVTVLAMVALVLVLFRGERPPVEASLTTCLAPGPVSDAQADACRRVLAEGTLHPDGLAAIHDVIERHDCQAPLDALDELISVGDLDAASVAWGKLALSCQRRFEPHRPSEATLFSLAASSRRTCVAALDGGTDEAMLRACEPYALVACRAPVIEFPRAGDTFDFRRDPVLASFLAARQRSGAPAWRCPGAVIPGPPPETTFASPAWSAALQPVLQAWMNGYQGRAEQLLETAEVSPEEREAFTRDFTAVRDAYDAARERLAEGIDAPADTESLVRAALDADARFLFHHAPTDAERQLLHKQARSAYVSTSKAMGDLAYARGKRFAELKDFRRACAEWKRGFTFTRGHLDLLKALTNVCTQRARRTLDDARTCDELREVFDFAVDGDGLADQAQTRLDEASCR